MANKDWQLFVFDWDGTLMDTTSLIMKGYQHASVELGYPKPSDELVLSTIGLNRSDSIGICCSDCPPRAAMRNLLKPIWIGMRNRSLSST